MECAVRPCVYALRVSASRCKEDKLTCVSFDEDFGLSVALEQQVDVLWVGASVDVRVKGMMRWAGEAVFDIIEDYSVPHFVLTQSV